MAMQSNRVNEKIRDAAGVRALMLFTAAALAVCTAAPALADQPDARTQTYAERLAIGVCGTCHGPHGNSEQPKFPRLAGQNDNYLAAQLKAFRAETRGDPDAISYMWGMARQLDDATIDALAGYYSRQNPRASGGGDPALIARGKDVYEHGIESKGVPACASCHGPAAAGMAAFPRLAGQHAQYVLKQLRSFQSNMRNVAVMHGVTMNLPEQEMAAVAAYLESVR
jgi:cytochrome c553